MTNREINLLKWILGGGFVCIFLVLLEMLFTKNSSTIFSIIIAFLTTCVYLVIAIAKIVQNRKWLKQYKHETLKKVKNQLNQEFHQVFLKDSSDIPDEKIECQAKIDNDGKIICKIHVNFDTTLDSYEDFLKYFYISKN